MAPEDTNTGDVTGAPTIGVVTVVYRSESVLPAFLDSLQSAVCTAHALVVADNAPGTDSPTAALVAAHGGTLVPLPGNPGYGAAVNAGVAALPQSVQWIVISNPDVVFRPASIARLVEVGESEEGIGAVGPAVENADGSIYPSARAIPSLRTGIGHALFGNLFPTNRWTTQYRDAAVAAGERRNVGWLSGSCLLVRRSAFDAIEGFDEGYFMYFEDVDLGYRLGKAGYRSVYEPASRALHTGAHSTTAESARMIRAHHASARRFLARKYTGWHLAPVRGILYAGLAARSAIAQRAAARPRRGQA